MAAAGVITPKTNNGDKCIGNATDIPGYRHPRITRQEMTSPAQAGAAFIPRLRSRPPQRRGLNHPNQRGPKPTQTFELLPTLIDSTEPLSGSPPSVTTKAPDNECTERDNPIL